MKKLLPCFLLFILLLFTKISWAQKVEFTAGISGNFSNYGGTAASSVGPYYSSVVFSKKLTAGYGANLQVKFIAKDGFMMGFQSGYDVLNSRSDINSQIVINYYTANILPNNSPYGLGAILTNYGYVINTTKFVNANPFVGYRLNKKKYALDFFMGADVSFVAEDKNHTVYSSPYDYNETFYYDRAKIYGADYPKTDVRIKAGIGVNYHRFGIDVSYEHGITNLSQSKIGNAYSYSNIGSAYSQVVRLGVNYKLL